MSHVKALINNTMTAKVIILLCVLSSALARQIPQDLLLGTATAAFQIEGAWNEDGKGESIWDRFLHSANRENGDVTCDSYHKWQEDVAHIKALGLDHYRFSIGWSRIMPNGTLNVINHQGVDYYMNLIRGLKAEGIEPLVTIYHWDMPQHISDLGGFLNPQFVDYFADYARLMYQLYAPYVKYWITINEPLSICSGGYGSGVTAPGLELIGDGIYQCSYVLLKAHARAWRIYDEEFRRDYQGKVGIVLNTNWFEPYSDKDEEARERYLQFYLGWYANPVFLGNWPQVMIERVASRSSLEGLSKSRLPTFTQEEIDYINGTHDFFAINTYKCYRVLDQDHEISYPSFNFDLGAVYGEQLFYPEGFRKLLNFINDRYRPESIIVTENGLETTDYLDDDDRIDYIRQYLKNLLDARELDGINIFGYTVWSLMDNFEWGSYDSRFGLIGVDFESANKTRTWKNSAKWFQRIIASRELDV